MQVEESPTKRRHIYVYIYDQGCAGGGNNKINGYPHDGFCLQMNYLVYLYLFIMICKDSLTYRTVPEYTFPTISECHETLLNRLTLMVYILNMCRDT